MHKCREKDLGLVTIGNKIMDAFLVNGDLVIPVGEFQRGTLELEIWYVDSKSRRRDALMTCCSRLTGDISGMEDRRRSNRLKSSS